jgi:hypothetical protein
MSRLPCLALVSLASTAGLLCATAARAEVADTTASLGSGTLSFATELQAGVYESWPLMINLHEAVGLAGGFDLVLRQGLPLSGGGFYFGGAVKWTLLHASSRATRPGIALWLGGHGRTGGGGGGVDATIAIDYPFGRVRPYLGVDGNLEFRDDIDFLLGLILGAQISLVNHVALFVEGGLGIIGAPEPHFVAVGIRVYI